MRDVFRFLGMAGVVLMVVGILSYALSGIFDLWTAIHLTGGSVLAATGILLNLAGFRRTVASRGSRQRAGAVTGTLLFGALLVSLNVMAMRHPWRYDATENRVHTLSEKTRALIAGLEEPVEILVFLSTEDPDREAMGDLLERFAAAGSGFRWRFVDPVRDPGAADRYEVRRQRVVVAVRGDTRAREVLDRNLGLTEGMVTNLLLKLTRPGPGRIFAVMGHGEPAIDDLETPEGLGALARVLDDQNLRVEALLLATVDRVPEDAALLMIVGPTKSLTDHEVKTVRRHLDGGGRLLLMIDPGTEASLEPVLADFRVLVGDDMIVDQEQVPFLGPRLGVAPIIEDFRPHPITRHFRERISLLQARSVSVRATGGLPGVEAVEIALTRAEAWAERDYREMLRSRLVAEDDQDLTGPVAVAVAAWRAPQPQAGTEAAAAPAGDEHAVPPEARVVVLGDSDLARNANLGAFFNEEFLLAVIEWLTGNEAFIGEGPRGLRPSRLDMTQADYRNLFRLSVLLLPEAILILGLSMWWWRRSL